MSDRTTLQLTQQHGLGSLLAEMNVQLRSCGVDPESFARRHRNLRRLGNDDEVARLDSLNQLADVKVCVTLGAHFLAVISHGPLVAP